MMLCLVSSLPLLKPARRLDKHHLLETHTFALSPKTSPLHEDYSVSGFFYQKIIDKV
jgi:hypothetical protein